MRSITLIILAVLAINLAAQELHVCKDILELENAEIERYNAKLNFRSSSFTRDYDAIYHRMHWEVDPAFNYIKGEVITHFIPMISDFDQIHFDLADELTVNAVIYNGQNADFRKISEDVLQIDLPNILTPGLLDSVIIEYEGSPPQNGFGAFTTSVHEGTPVMWTLSQPYGAKDWWPCKQDLIDKVDSIDVFVTTPSEYRVASNGQLIDEVEENGNKTFHWSHRYPIPAYLIAIAITNYSVYSEYIHLSNGDSIEFLNYVFPEDLAQAQADTRFTPAMLELFNDLFGLYPFSSEKYGHAQFGWGGGMEHQTMSFMGGFSFELQAHELAHQWFGDKVTCGSWQDIWLNEGFATYLTGLSIEHLSSETFWYNWKAGNLARVVSEPDGAIFVDDTTNVGRIFNGRLSYSKGGLVLHMLRWILGDEDFYQACRNYLEDPNLAFSYALTEDLRGHMEKVFGDELDFFFNDWIYGEGYPSYQVQWSQTNSILDLQIYQEPSHPSVDFFELPLPISVYGEGVVRELKLWNTINGQSYSLPMDIQVDSIVFDRDIWLITKDNDIEEVITNARDLTLQLDHAIGPNPFTNQLRMEVPQNLGAYQYYVFDAAGKLVFSGNGGGTTQLSTRDWLSGLYSIRLNGNQWTAGHGLIKVE